MQLLPVLLISFFAAVHPLHISVTDITLDEKERELEIMVRVFADDLEQAIRTEKQNKNLSFVSAGSADIDKLAWEYMKPRFKLSIDGELLAVNYLGHEKDEDVFVFYIQVQPAKKFETISVTNTIITEFYEDQSNLVNVTLGENTKSLRLMRNNPSGKLSFE